METLFLLEVTVFISFAVDLPIVPETLVYAKWENNSI